MKVQILRLPHARDLPLPTNATAGAAGVDLLAAVDADIELAPGARAAVPCGIALALPEHCEGQVRPRSGLALRHGIAVLNAPGTVDSDYRGEVKVILINLGEHPFRISRGLKIAQMVFASCLRAEFIEVTELPSSSRGAGGFGSTDSTAS